MVVVRGRGRTSLVVRGAERMEERALPRGLSRQRAWSVEERRADIDC